MDSTRAEEADRHETEIAAPTVFMLTAEEVTAELVGEYIEDAKGVSHVSWTVIDPLSSTVVPS